MVNIAVDGGELPGGVTPPEVVAPAPKYRVEVCHHRADGSAHLISSCCDLDLTSDQGLTAIGRPFLDASTDEVYAAMDWLLGRQDCIEAVLAKRHLQPGGMAMFDLSSSWVEGHRCELAAFGYSRDRKRGSKQVEYGLLTDRVGRPVGIRVFPGNTSDTTSFTEAVTMVRDKFGLDRLTMVDDRGMITSARIKELRQLPGMDWTIALRAPAIAALAGDDGPLQMSLFDTQDFAEIVHPDYPGERLICCRNPALAEARARKRETLLVATDKELNKIADRVSSGKLSGKDAIGVAVGKVINKYKGGKHVTLDIGDTEFGSVATKRRFKPSQHWTESM